MTWQTLEVTTGARIATVTLNRPQVRNAFDDACIAEITQAFHELGDDDGVRAIVLAARGPVFCAGADLHWMKKMAGYSREENRADAQRLAAMLRTIDACAKPVMAKVQGDCYGGGVGLAAACDIVIASDKATFCLSEVKLGLIPATISPYVIRAMGEHAARRYFLTAERFSARDAHRIGFAHEVAAEEELDRVADGIVKTLISNGPHAVHEAKRLVRDVAGAILDDALIANTVERIVEVRASDEGKEGMRAFLEKRKPGWLD
jgi:methylglutaconyl-CoA hydratase